MGRTDDYCEKNGDAGGGERHQARPRQACRQWAANQRMAACVWRALLARSGRRTVQRCQLVKEADIKPEKNEKIIDLSIIKDKRCHERESSMRCFFTISSTLG